MLSNLRSTTENYTETARLTSSSFRLSLRQTTAIPRLNWLLIVLSFWPVSAAISFIVLSENKTNEIVVCAAGASVTNLLAIAL